MPRCPLLVMIGLALVSAAWADDSPWPQWRGPNRDAVSTEKNLLDHWDGEPPLIWKAQGIGDGYAGAVIESGTVCTVGDQGERTTVFGIRDKDGQVIWRTEIDDYKKPEERRNEKGEVKHVAHGYTGSKSTPTIDGDRVYALSSYGVLACLNIATGKILWEKSFLREYDGVGPEWGYSESPLIDGDKLICTPGGPEAGMVALNKKTGEELWRYVPTFSGRKGNVVAGYASAVISYGGGIKQYVQFIGRGNGGLVGVDAETGKQLWSSTRITGNSNICTPVIRGDYLFAPCSHYRGSVLLKLEGTKDGGIKAEEVYFLSTKRLQTYLGGAVLVGDYVYTSDSDAGSPQCIHFLTGEMMWEKEPTSGSGPAMVIYADGHLYFRFQNGVMMLIAASPEHQVKGEFKIPNSRRQNWALPAISNGRLYVRDYDAMYCYDVRKEQP